MVSKKLKAESGVVVRGDCTTDRMPLAEGAFEAEQVVDAMAERCPQLDCQVLEHLALTYGTASADVLALVERDPGFGARVVPHMPYIRAEVPYAIQHEMAMTLNDWMIRRTHIMHEDEEQGLGCAAQVAAMMAPHLDWDTAEKERQMHAYNEQVRLSQSYHIDSTPQVKR